MLSSGATKSHKKKSVGLISKKTTLQLQHTFLYISLPFFCTTSTRNFQKHPSYTFYVFLSTFFFAAAHFHLGGRQHFPMFLTATIKFSCFSFNEIGLLCFLSLALALSPLSTSMQILKSSRKKESALLLLFLSLKAREAMRFTAETRRCLKCKISSRLKCRGGRTCVLRTDDFLRTKISWMHRLPNFLTHGALLRPRDRARAPL